MLSRALRALSSGERSTPPHPGPVTLTGVHLPAHGETKAERLRGEMHHRETLSSWAWQPVPQCDSKGQARPLVVLVTVTQQLLTTLVRSKRL